MSKKLSLFSLALLIIASIDSVRNLPAPALFGPSLIFCFLLSALVFLIPTALVSAELSAAFPEKGGIYHWVHTAFGKRWAMVAIWLQWINTMIWYPAMLSFIAATAAYLIDPALVQHKGYLICVSLSIFWLLTLVNLRGLHVSAQVNNFCALIGMVIPMLFLIGLGAFWFLKGESVQIAWSWSGLIPSLEHESSWVSLIAIMASFLGMELSGVHVSDIKEPQRNFPKAVFIAAFFILLSMILGSLAIAVVLPASEINLVAGVMQVVSDVCAAFGLTGLTPALALLIVVGTIGSLTNWLIAPAKGLLHAAEFGFLPAFFSRKNKAGAPYNLMIGQGVIVSLISLLYLAEPSVNGFYWFLTALSTELYMVMYLLMFVAAIKLHYTNRRARGVFKIPGKGAGIWTVALLGIVGALATVGASFLPPGNIDIGSGARYVAMIGAGNVVALLPLLLFYAYEGRKGARGFDV